MIQVSKRAFKLMLPAMVGVVVAAQIFVGCNSGTPPAAPVADTKAKTDTGEIFVPPDTSTIPHDPFGDMVRYGRDLVLNTAKYIGPNGTVGHYLGNKMNCTNCHLDAGTKPFGYNFFSTHARYPQYRGRENQILTLGQRINNCIERPHSGTPMPLDSKEIVAIVCYIKWLGGNTTVGKHVKGDDGLELQYPNRPADPNQGAAIYATHCTECHGKDGQGQWNGDSSTYIYPPLWGKYSYQVGSSPHRVLKMARFVKGNMPFNKAMWNHPILTDEQAIDVAAFVNDDRIHPRPQKKDKATPDYPDKKFKPIDYGYGPYEDPFSETQHKFGPYQPIIDYHKEHKLPIVF